MRKTIAAVMDAVAWQRANRAEAIKMIAARFKISPSEAEQFLRDYDEYSFARRQHRHQKSARLLRLCCAKSGPIPENLDAEKLVDFSMLPSAR